MVILIVRLRSKKHHFLFVCLLIKKKKLNFSLLDYSEPNEQKIDGKSNLETEMKNLTVIWSLIFSMSPPAIVSSIMLNMQKFYIPLNMH